MRYLKTLSFIHTIMFLSVQLSHAQATFRKASYTSSKGDTLLYQILYPKDYDPTKKYPLILFLHGAGERGKDNEKQMTHGASLFLDEKNQKDFPAIVVFPQCPSESYWASAVIDRSNKPYDIKFDYTAKPTPTMESCTELLQQLIEKEAVDKNRIYVMGMSMGGMGTLELVSRNPDLFAAAIPICGGADLHFIKNYKRIPMWIFHGEKDDTVDVRYSRELYAQLKLINPDAAYTEYPGIKHDSWDNAFKEPELLKWLFRQKLK